LRILVGDTRDTAEMGRYLVAAELVTRGGRCVEEDTGLHRRLLAVRNHTGDRLTVIVKTRLSGTWQASINDGDITKAAPNTFWIFVDLAGDEARPAFFIAPDVWVRSDVSVHHQEYLDRHGGHRAETEDSVHHAIPLERIHSWIDRWDLLNLGDTGKKKNTLASV
jgi:hypothetical protein